MSWLLDAFVAYLVGLSVAPALPAGRLRRACELLYAPFVRLGLWYRWSMYAPDAPTETRIAVPGVVLEDGRFEVVQLPGFDGVDGFGDNGGLRFIAFQWALTDPLTDHLKPAVADRALTQWRQQRPADASGAEPVALEVRLYAFASPPPGASDGPIEPDVSTLWRRELVEGEP